MKYRNGFVSNSSSSSFIAIGTLHKFDCKDDTFVEALYENEKVALIGDDYGLKHDEYLEGYYIDMEDVGYKEIEITEDMVGKKIVLGVRLT